MLNNAGGDGFSDSDSENSKFYSFNSSLQEEGNYIYDHNQSKTFYNSYLLSIEFFN